MVHDMVDQAGESEKGHSLRFGKQHSSGSRLGGICEQPRAVFAHERGESVIEDKKHTKEQSNFEEPPLLRILHKPLPAPRPLLSLAFGAAELLLCFGLKAAPKTESAFSTPIALQTLPFVDEL